MHNCIDFERNIGSLSELSIKKSNILKKKILFELESSGSILIKKFPINKSINSNIRNFKKIMSLLGKLLPQNEKKEKIIQIKDYSGKKWNATTRGYKTKDYLDVHTDGGSIAGMLCITPADKGGESTSIKSSYIFQSIKNKKKLIKQLSDGFEYHTRKVSKSSEVVTKKKYPVFFKHKGRLCCMYNRKPIIEAAKINNNYNKTAKILNCFDKYIYKNKKHMQIFKLEKGDIWIVNNYKILHGRKAFNNNINKRLMLRAWVNPTKFKYSGKTILDAYNDR